MPPETITVHPPERTWPCGYVWPDPPQKKKRKKKKKGKS